MSSNEFIWRIESGAGQGAYHAGMCYGFGNEVEYGSAFHPGPIEDGISKDGWTPTNLFGFQSIHHARRWFSSIHDLRKWEGEFDARVVAYRRDECHSLQEGGSQMVFTPIHSGRKASFPASRLHDQPITTLMDNARGVFARLHESVA